MNVFTNNRIVLKRLNVLVGGIHKAKFKERNITSQKILRCQEILKTQEFNITCTDNQKLFSF